MVRVVTFFGDYPRSGGQLLQYQKQNTGFHELAGAWSLDRAFVHKGRPTAAMAIVILALMAFNAFQVYIYRHLGLDPGKPSRTLGDIRRDFLETLSLTRLQVHARAP